jgi:hypothetical protein
VVIKIITIIKRVTKLKYKHYHSRLKTNPSISEDKASAAELSGS